MYVGRNLGTRLISRCRFGKKTYHCVVGHQVGAGFVVVGQLGAVVVGQLGAVVVGQLGAGVVGQLGAGVVGQLSNVVSLDLHDVDVCKLYMHHQQQQLLTIVLIPLLLVRRKRKFHWY